MTGRLNTRRPVRNALVAPALAAAPHRQSRMQAPPIAALLAGAIGHAAVLSDTPGKWAATIAMLRRHGIDPEGYEDFEKGRPLAIAAAGLAQHPAGD